MKNIYSKTVILFSILTIILNANLLLAQELTISPETLNFPVIRSGQTTSLDVEINNTGAQELTISDIYSTDGYFDVDDSYDRNIPAGEKDTILVSFNPTSPGNYSGTLNIVSNAGTEQLPLTGKATVSSIQGAIELASAGDTILVGPGTYYESIDFGGKGITVLSTDGANKTIIDAKTYSGNGADGVLYVANGQTYKTDAVKTTVTGTNPSGNFVLNVTSTTGFSVGDEVLVITMQDSTTTDPAQNVTGQYETRSITAIDATQLQFDLPYTNTYNATNQKHQVVRIPNFTNVTVDGTLTCDTWNGVTGGVVFFRATGEVVVNPMGKIDLTAKGYRGITDSSPYGKQGESMYGLGTNSVSPNMGAGGGGLSGTSVGNGGGGAGYAASGQDGELKSNSVGKVGEKGMVYGTPDLSKLFLGTAGGAGSREISHFGNGADGDLTVTGTYKTDQQKTAVIGNNSTGSSTLTVSDASVFSVGDEVLIICMRDQNTSSQTSSMTGRYETHYIMAINANTLTLDQPLTNTYYASNRWIQAIRVSNFRNVTVNSSSNITCDAWNGATGGVVFFRAIGKVEIQSGGQINVTGLGYRGGGYGVYGDYNGYRGENYIYSQNHSKSNNALYNGGGGGTIYNNDGGSGGGGGYASNGSNATGNGFGYGGNDVFTSNWYNRLLCGGSGGGGGGTGRLNNPSFHGGNGGNSGGIIAVYTQQLISSGYIYSNGSNGSNQSGGYCGGGGGGAGGTIVITAESIRNNSVIQAIGGNGGNGQHGPGGTGSTGRVRFDYATGGFSGNASNPAVTYQPTIADETSLGYGGAGGNGGGIAYIAAKNKINVLGTIESNGDNGGDAAGSGDNGGGGAGSGGSLHLIASDINNDGDILAQGATGGNASSAQAGNGGNSSEGRIRLDYNTYHNTLTYTLDPAPGYEGEVRDDDVLINAFTANSGETNSAVLDGFYIRGKKTLDINNASPVIQNCILSFTPSENEASAPKMLKSTTLETIGGYILNINNGTPHFENVEFHGQTSNFQSGSFEGTYIRTSADSVVFDDCDFTNLQVNLSDRAVSAKGGIIYQGAGKTVFNDCAFSNNALTGASATQAELKGLYYLNAGEVAFNNTSFTENSLNATGASPEGGLFYVKSGELSLFTCTVDSNTISSNNTGYGAFVYVEDSSNISIKNVDIIKSNGAQEVIRFENGGVLDVENVNINGYNSHGIYSSSGELTVTMDNTNINYNTGRGLWTNGNKTLKQVSISNNGSDGIKGSGSITMNICTVDSNSVTGITDATGYIIADSTSISGNGGQGITSTCALTFTHVDINGNDRGVTANGEANFTDVNINDNKGFALNSPGNKTFENVSISRNTGYGINGDGILNFTHVNINDNTGYGLTSNGQKNFVDVNINNNAGCGIDGTGAANFASVTISDNDSTGYNGFTDSLIVTNTVIAHNGFHGILGTGSLDLNVCRIDSNSVAGITGATGNITADSTSVSGNGGQAIISTCSFDFTHVEINKNGSGISGNGEANFTHVTIDDNSGFGMISTGDKVFEEVSICRNTGYGVNGDGILNFTDVDINDNTGYGLTSNGQKTFVDVNINNNGDVGIAGTGSADFTRVNINNNNNTGFTGFTTTLTALNTTISANGNGGLVGSGTVDMTLDSCRLDSNTTLNNGAAIQLIGTIDAEDVELHYNSGSNGGAIYLDGEMIALNSNFTNNESSDQGGGFWIAGALTLTDCTINNNTSTNEGAGIYGDGDTLTITGSEIHYNSAATDGGGLWWGSTGGVQIDDSDIRHNHANNHGGGLFILAHDPQISYNVIANNSAQSNGGAIYISNTTETPSQPLLVNNTIVYNTATSYGGGMLCRTLTHPEVRNTIFWGNESSPSRNKQIEMEDRSDINVYYSDIEGMGDGIGSSYTVNIDGTNLNTYPVFENRDAEDYHLKGASLCIDAGDPAYYDRDGSRRDMGAYSFDKAIVVGFETDVESGNAPLTVQFTDISTGYVTAWKWDFDNDGTVDAEEQHPPYTYENEGLYSVSLVISNGTESDTLVQENSITVLQPILSVDPEYLNVTRAAGIDSFLISNTGTGTMGWTATADSSWITITGGESGIDDDKVVFSYENNLGDERTGTITVNAPDAQDPVFVFELRQSGQDVTLAQQVNEGWNLIGLPFEVLHNHVDSLFPNAMDNSLYSWDGAYNLNTALEKGTGYWLRFPADETVEITGTEFDSIAVDLIQGWNIIAGPSVDVPAGDIEDPGNIIMAGSLYEYAGAYNLANTVQPGNGYWVRANQAGQIILKASTNKSGNAFTDLNLCHKISISDNAGFNRILYFNVEPEYPLTKENYALPPVPFDGIFDVRFSGNYRLEENSYGEIHLQSADYPLTVSFSEFEQDNGKQYVLQEYAYGAALNTHPVKDGTTVMVDNTTVSLLKIMEQVTVSEGFEVYQNSPNPFGEETEIGYRLPEATNVTIEIYTMMGQKLVTLLDARQEAGYHTITWDGTDSNGTKMSEGIYLYKVTAYGEVQTRRMVVMQ